MARSKAIRKATTPVFLDEFVETLKRIDLERDGFAVEAIAAVEMAFGYVEPSNRYWSGGFVLRLRKGGRVLLASSCGPTGWEDTDTPTVQAVPQELVDRAARAGKGSDRLIVNWAANAEGLNRFLRYRARRSAARTFDAGKAVRQRSDRRSELSPSAIGK